MKIKKNYTLKASSESRTQKLDAYVRLATAYQSNQRLRSKSAFTRNLPLASVIPLAAIAFAPIDDVKAQCQPTTAAVSGSGTNRFVDVDDDGTDDFHIRANASADMFIGLEHANAELLCDKPGAFYYAIKLTTGNTLAQGNANWRGTATLPNGGIGDQCTMDYNDTAGRWDGGCSAADDCLVGVRINSNRIGFIQVFYVDPPPAMAGTVTFGILGIQSTNIAGQNLAAVTCANLPVEMIRFDGLAVEGSMRLSWITATENNNVGFEVQRSTNGKDYEKVGWVDGQGNSYEEIEYSFEDIDIDPNVQYYYRLKQIDYDGSEDITDAIVLVWEDAHIMTVDDISPNPVRDSYVHLGIHAKSERDISIQLYNSVGQLISRQDRMILDGYNKVMIELSNVPNDMYYIKVEGERFSTYKKLVVAR